MNDLRERRGNDHAAEDAVQIIDSSAAIEALNRSEIDVQISTANRFKRDLTTVKNEIMSIATMDVETAEMCFYSLPRGGKNIQGPSVRLAEIAISCYRNVRIGSRVVGFDGERVTVQAVCFDLEKNIAVTIEKARLVQKKRGSSKPDADMIMLASNAAMAIAFRDAAFKVIPMALIRPAYLAAKQCAIGDAKTLVDRRAAALERFGKMGVSKDQVLAFLGRKTEDEIDLADIEKLIGAFNAIADGEATIESLMRGSKGDEPSAAANELNEALEASANTETPADKAPAEPAADTSGKSDAAEVTPPSKPKPTAAAQEPAKKASDASVEADIEDTAENRAELLKTLAAVMQDGKVGPRAVALIVAQMFDVTVSGVPDIGDKLTAQQIVKLIEELGSRKK